MAETLPHQQDEEQQHNRDLVIHGEPADYTRYPYFALVGDYCGGSLIAPDIVLTAGHCKQVHRRYRHEIRIGPKTRHYHYNYNYDDEDADEEGDDDRYYSDRTSIRHKSIYQVRHPGFKRRGDDEFTNDILIIQLAEPSDRPVIRLEKEMIHSTPVLAMGMGWTKKYKPSVSNHLNVVKLDTIENDICSQTTARNMTYDGRIDDSMMCTTGGEGNERDTCNNDSGSPIIIPGRSPQQDRLVGMVSWGTECADPDFPAVNTRISASYEWIQSTTCSLSRYPPVYLCGNSAGGNFFVQYELWWYIGAVLPGVLYYCVRQWWRHCNDNKSGKPQQHHLYSAIADVVIHRSHGTDEGDDIEHSVEME